MFDAPAVEADLRTVMFERSEGNPFVLEEMLKEAIERGDIVRTDVGWERRSLGDLEIPETVRDTILLRLQRLHEEHTTILQAAAALGRSFDYPTLVTVSGADEGAVNEALEAAIGQQLIEEHPEAPGAYRWRHALTQEAIYTDMVTPRRQQLHSRAADALTAQASMRSVDVAHHLLGAARFAEAVPVCLRSADEAERALAYGDAVAVLERVLPHVTDPLERARALCAIGRLSWFNGQPAAAAQFLIEGVEGLESLGQPVEAARFRIYLGRCHWESSRSDLADESYEAARSVLEAVGPSADLATAYVRIAGLRVFEFDYDGCVEAAQRGMEVGEAADADFERTWAHAFLAMGLLGSDVERGLEVSDAVYEEAFAKGYWLVASNTTYNDIWCRVHLVQPGLEERFERLNELPFLPAAFSLRLSRGYVRLETADLPDALEAARAAIVDYELLRQAKMLWRANVNTAEVLVEMGRAEEAAGVLPPVSERSDLQDIVYDGNAQIRVRLDRGQVADAVELAEEILEHGEELAMYRGTLAVAVEAFLAAGRIDERACGRRQRSCSAEPGRQGAARRGRGARAARRSGRRKPRCRCCAPRSTSCARSATGSPSGAQPSRSPKHSGSPERPTRLAVCCGTSFRGRRPSRRCASPRPLAPSPVSWASTCRRRSRQESAPTRIRSRRPSGSGSSRRSSRTSAATRRSPPSRARRSSTSA